MRRNPKREAAYLRQTLNRANCLASDAHVKVDSKETRLALLESDKTTKDTKISDLEADKASKDTAIADLTSRISALENGGVSSGGGSLTSEAVSWTNLSEINLSGEKLVDGDFSNTTDLADKLIANASSFNSYVRQDVSVNGTYVQSIEIKEALASGTSSFMLDQYFSGIQGRNRIRIDLNGSSAPTVSAAGYGNANNVTVTSLADDWYRIDLQITLSSGSAQVRFGALRTGDEVLARNASLKASGTTTELLTSNSSFSSGWKKQNTTVVQGSGVSLDSWTVTSGTLDQSKLVEGIVKGSGGVVSIQQTFSNGIASGTALVCKVTRTDISSGFVSINALRANGSSFMSGLFILPSDGFIEFTTTEIMHGLRLSTSSVVREVSSISLFQGTVSGGTAQAYAGGNLEKISGTNGWNAGASSTQKIDGNSNGYVQFQWAADKSVRVGLVYLDDDYGIPSPSLSITATQLVATGNKTVAVGDWFRIRHYAADNQIKYQRKEEIFDTDGNSLGEDYVTFYTEPTLTNGSDLYVDASLYHVGSQINDATIVK